MQQNTKEVIQTTPLEDREVTITINYGIKEVFLYTNNATVMNRLMKDGIEYYSEQTKCGIIIARQYKLPMKEIKQFLKVANYRVQD